MQNAKLAVTAAVVFTLAIVGGVLFQQSGSEITFPVATIQRATRKSPNANVVWPPRIGSEYPDIELRSLDGTAGSSFRVSWQNDLAGADWSGLQGLPSFLRGPHCRRICRYATAVQPQKFDRICP